MGTTPVAGAQDDVETCHARAGKVKMAGTAVANQLGMNRIPKENKNKFQCFYSLIEAALVGSTVRLHIPDTSDRFVNALKKISPAFYLSVFVLLSFFTLVYRTYGGQLIFRDGSITIPLISLSVILLIQIITKVRSQQPLKQILKNCVDTSMDWLPFPILLFVYENLKGRIHMITQQDFTEYLMNIDQWIFGVQPTLALEAIVHPVLTDVLALCYASYFLIPFFPILLAFLKNRRTDFQFGVTSILLCFYLGYIGYISFPAVIPKFYLRESFTIPLHGLFLHQYMDKLYEKANAAQMWGAFPSLHIAISTLGLMLAYDFEGLVRTKRLLFWLMLPVVLGLWFSTLYLRYHWTIDILAGWLLALLSFSIVKITMALWPPTIGKSILR